MTLPDFLRHELSNPPKAGAGVHNWLFRMARQLHQHLPAGQIISLLETKVAACGRHVPRNEIVAAVQSSLGCAWHPDGNHATRPAAMWPSVNEAKRKQIVEAGDGLADLWERSPVRIEDNNAHTEAIIDRLFPGNPLLCVGVSSKEFATRTRDELRGELARLQLIVPSPMSAAIGTTKDGRTSAHTLDNTGPRRFLVIEFDNGTPDEHAALLLHLAGIGPMALAVHSGGKSLHGWFFCAGQNEERLRGFMRYAVSLGADRATWLKSQFVRMPDGTRDNGQRQTVFFFRPEVCCE